MIGPNVTRLMWIFLIANIALVIGDAFTGRVTMGFLNGSLAGLLAVVIAIQADRRREQP